MKVLFTYFPHYSEDKGYLLVSQNRFTKYRGNPELIYPIIPASSLTLLKQNGFQVGYIDAIANQLSFDDYIKEISLFNPDVLFFETKTPCIKKDWETVRLLKKNFPEILIGSCGDHVSVLPEETMENSMVDYTVLGGDYDYGIFLLCESLTGKRQFPKGIVYRDGNKKIINNNDPVFLNDLDEIPIIDRNIVPWNQYHEAWRLYDEFTYIMGSRGCPYRCTFCSWPQMLYQGKVRFRKPEYIVKEMQYLVKNHGIKELFFDDDTFTCNKKWVLDICKHIEQANLNVLWSCNGRVDNVDLDMLKKMKKNGCRLIKYGVESASPGTIEKINKGYTLEDVKKSFYLTQKSGILIHATAMIGFPWETKGDMINTMNFIKNLKPDTCQFSIPIAYPGTKLFSDAEKNNWLNFGRNWEKYDMSLPTLKNDSLSSEEIVELCKKAWINVYLSPGFMLRKIKKLRKFSILKWYMRGLKSVLAGHLNFDFLKRKKG